MKTKAFRFSIVLCILLLLTSCAELNSPIVTSEPPFATTESAIATTEPPFITTDSSFITTDPPVTTTKNDILRDYEWYIDLGLEVGNNCGPAVTCMAAKWYDKNINRTASSLRNEITPGHKGWWYVNDIATYFNKYNIRWTMGGIATTQNLIKHIESGNIIILCINTLYFTKNNDSESHYGKFYDDNGGHFILVKGYITGDDGHIYFETYDPGAPMVTYKDGTFKGKDRYYSSVEIESAAFNWWNNFIVILNPKA